MNPEYPAETEAFRQKIRDFLAENLPEGWKGLGGLPAEDGPSGPKPDAPQPSGTVQGTNGGDVDQLALLSLNDIDEFWRYTYPGAFPGRPSSLSGRAAPS